MSQELAELSSQAISQGYMVTPFTITDSSSLVLKQNALNMVVRDTLLRNFINDQVIDRLTYTRDYGITKSINFMVIGKDMKGNAVAVGHFIYSKSSKYIYLKDFMVSSGCDAKALVAFMSTAAKDYMAENGFEAKGFIASPSIRGRHAEAVEFMRSLGMGFMSVEPKTDGTLLKRPGSVFEVYKGSHVLDRRVLMVGAYGAGGARISGETLSKFLSDLKDEKDLAFLLMRLDDAKVSVVESKSIEISKLASLLGKIRVPAQAPGKND
ncbi:MAG: hypothetical protein N3H30_01400 [Candidatus Micrarchaeota archaeon]|nr:hypothetical protein [Candidatus Micrarchaeota archaeon]